MPPVDRIIQLHLVVKTSFIRSIRALTCVVVRCRVVMVTLSSLPPLLHANTCIFKCAFCGINVLLQFQNKISHVLVLFHASGMIRGVQMEVKTAGIPGLLIYFLVSV